MTKKKIEEEKRNWLDDIRDGTDAIEDVDISLCQLAKSFSRLGNDKVADELFDCVKWLREASKKIRDGSGKALNDMVSASQRSLQTTFVASLAGACLTNEARETVRPLAEAVAKQHEKDS